MDINKQLNNLYTSKFSNLTIKINEYNNTCEDKENCATNPLMLRTNDEWTNADLKIMIIGQENNVWGGEFGNDGAFCGKIDEVIDIYEQFYINDKMYACPFWNEYRNVKDKTKSQGKKYHSYGIIS